MIIQSTVVIHAIKTKMFTFHTVAIEEPGGAVSDLPCCPRLTLKAIAELSVTLRPLSSPLSDAFRRVLHFLLLSIIETQP